MTRPMHAQSPPTSRVPRSANQPRNSSFTIDEILDGQLALRQPRRGERISIDAVLAAAAVPAKPGDTILDAGAGSGAIGLCIARRVPETKIVGIDVDRNLVELAAGNAKRNDLSPAVLFQCADITLNMELSIRVFDHVVTNPPFYPAGRGRVSPNPARARAHAEQGVALADWIDGCQRRLRPGGTLTVIFPAERLDDLLFELGRKAGSLRIFPLWPKTGKAAKRVIVQARRGGKARVQLLSGMVLHRADGRYSARAEKILRRGMRLAVSG